MWNPYDELTPGKRRALGVVSVVIVLAIWTALTITEFVPPSKLPSIPAVLSALSRLAWDPEREIRIRLGGFSKPLRWFASHFDETWRLTPNADGTTAVERVFELHPRGWWGAGMLWFVRPLMKRAVMKHMRQIGVV